MKFQKMYRNYICSKILKNIYNNFKKIEQKFFKCIDFFFYFLSISFIYQKIYRFFHCYKDYFLYIFIYIYNRKINFQNVQQGIF